MIIDRGKYEFDMKCGACIELNMVPDEGDKCIYTEKLCSRYENAKRFYGKDYEYYAKYK